LSKKLKGRGDVSGLFFNGFPFIGGIPAMLPLYFLDWFIHKDKQSKNGGYNSVEEHYELEGQLGQAKTDLRPAGIAIIMERRYDVVSEGDFVKQGETVQVVGIRDGRIIVRKL
jgi:membrane-bound serine protease (ClpP class)